MTTESKENRIPTGAYLFPEHHGFTVKPWEPQHHPARARNGVDDDALELGDPCAGWEVGPCQIIRRLSPGSVKLLLAIRADPREGNALVVMRQIDVPETLTREIQTHAEWAGRFRHPNLSRVYRCEASDEGIFWVSERTSGASFAELAEACRKLGKGLPVGLVLGAVYDAALALGELHVPSGFSHGLLSDRSVAVAFDGTTRLQDLGMFECIARQNSWPEVLETVGPYLAPEQLLAGRMPDTKCDVYSLGALLYECLSGQRLLRTANFDERVRRQATATFVPPSSLNPSLGKELDLVVATAMNVDRSKRYPDALQFARALKTAASSFIWRAELRANFVGQLFPIRRRREQVLLEGCAPRRSLTSPQLQMPAVVVPALPPLRVVAVKPSAPPVARAVVAPPVLVRKKTQVRALAMTLAAAALAWVGFSGVVPTDYEAYGEQPVPYVPAPVAVVPLPPPDVSLVCTEPEALPPPVVVASPEEELEELKPVKKVVRRKKNVDEIPDAPWLQPRRGRR